MYTRDNINVALLKLEVVKKKKKRKIMFTKLRRIF